MSAEKSKPKNRRGHKRNNSNFQLNTAHTYQKENDHQSLQQYIHSQTARLIELSKAKQRNVVVIERLDDNGQQKTGAPCGRFFQFGKRARNQDQIRDQNTFLEKIPEAPDSSNKKDQKFDSIMTTANSRECRKLVDRSKFVNDSLLIAKCPRSKNSKGKMQSVKHIPKRNSQCRSKKSKISQKNQDQVAPNVVIMSGSATKNITHKRSLRKPQSLTKILCGIEERLTRLNSRSHMIVQQNRYLKNQVRDIAEKQSVGSQLAHDMKQQIDEIRGICQQNRGSLAQIQNYFSGTSQLRHSQVW